MNDLEKNELIKKAKAQYMRDYRARKKEELKKSTDNYWLKKAAEMNISLDKEQVRV